MHNALEIGVYVFFNSIEQHSKFLLHTVQVLCMCTLFDSTGLLEMIAWVFNNLSYTIHLRCVLMFVES